MKLNILKNSDNTHRYEASKECIRERLHKRLVINEIYKGIIPKNKIICHSCDNPSCANPDHLFIGDQQDNVDDAVKKGRNFKIPPMPGEKNPLAKLSNYDAIQIRKRRKNDETGVSLAKEYNVSITIISRINIGKTYK
jgi:hypothetical protein